VWHRITAWRGHPPASAPASLPLPAALMQHGARKHAPHHASPSHTATSAPSAGLRDAHRAYVSCALETRPSQALRLGTR
jgi:hypothetical protein